MHVFNTVIAFFQGGGLFMYPIAIVLAVGLGIAVERWFYLETVRGDNRKTWKQLLPSLTSGDLDKARQIAAESKAAIAQILSFGFERHRVTPQRDAVELAMEEGLMDTLPRLERRTHYLATLANIATLLGLLGTIIGLIQAFTAVANVDPAEKADLLSVSISVAMNTTAFGLMAAIPLLLMHAWLQSKTTEVIDALEMASVKLLNSMAGSNSQS